MNLRRWEKKLCDTDRETETDGAFDLELQVQKGCAKVVLEDIFKVEYRDGVLVLEMDQQAGAGRHTRKACIEELRSIRILADTSAAEIYVNGGEVVFSTRFYGKGTKHRLKIEAEGFRGGIWKLEKMNITKCL